MQQNSQKDYPVIAPLKLCVRSQNPLLVYLQLAEPLDYPQLQPNKRIHTYVK